MKILFYFGHPAQYLFARETIRQLIERQHEVKLVIKTKDVLETLLKNDGLSYENILTSTRGNSKLSIILSLVRRNISLFPIIFKFKPDLLIGGDATIAQLGRLLNINRITVTEDDYEVIKSLSDITNPFTQSILAPTVCKVGKWNKKKIGYDGYMKLGYLHPKVFTFKKEIVDAYISTDKYVIIRLAKLTAHHDVGIKGIDNLLLDKLIKILENNSFKVLLSIEREIDKKYSSYIMDINPNDMHHFLNAASLLICDSQSMSVEASILGTPSLRISDFIGKISVLEELEHKYQLTFGIKPNNIDKLFSILNQLLSIEDLKEEFTRRKDTMLKDKINVSDFFTWFIENYPKSISVMKKNPSYQYKFK